MAFRLLNRSFSIALMFLTGCATQNVVLVQPIEDGRELDSETGLVVARVVNATAYPFPMNHITLAPDNVYESQAIKFQRLVAPVKRIRNTTVFASQLEPGRYSVSDINATIMMGDYVYTHTVPAELEMGTFNVEAGKITDLGTLIYYNKSDGESLTPQVLRSTVTRPGEVLDKYFTEVSYRKEELLSWIDDGNDAERATQYSGAASNPNYFAGRYRAPDRSLYFLGKLGVIVKRSQDGTWSMDAVDTDLEITAIAQDEQGALAIAAVEGQLFYRRPDGEWLEHTFDLDMTVDALAFTPDGQLDVVMAHGKSVTIFRGSPAEASPNWQEMNQYKTKVGWTTLPIPYEPNGVERKRGKLIRRDVSDVRIFEAGGQHFITFDTFRAADPAIFPPTRAETYRYNPSDWTVELADPAPEIKWAFPAGQKQIGLRPGSVWRNPGTLRFMTFDEGAGEWHELSARAEGCMPGDVCVSDTVLYPDESRPFDYEGPPWFATEKRGVAIGEFSSKNLAGIKKDSREVLLVTEDGGRSWRHTDASLPHENCTRIAPEAVDALIIYCNGITGDMYESKDLGKTWDHARQHQNL